MKYGKLSLNHHQIPTLPVSLTISGDPVTYTNWLPHKQNNHGGHRIEDCVEFLPRKGLWDDIPCGYYKDDDFVESEGYTKNFICQHGTDCLI